jgi:hypothetical protein
MWHSWDLFDNSETENQILKFPWVTSADESVLTILPKLEKLTCWGQESGKCWTNLFNMVNDSVAPIKEHLKQPCLQNSQHRIFKDAIYNTQQATVLHKHEKDAQ